MIVFQHSTMTDPASGATPQEPRICEVPAAIDLHVTRCSLCGDFYAESFVAQHEANGCIPRTTAPCEPPAELFRKWWKHQAIERTVKAQMKGEA